MSFLTLHFLSLHFPLLFWWPYLFWFYCPSKPSDPTVFSVFYYLFLVLFLCEFVIVVPCVLSIYSVFQCFPVFLCVFGNCFAWIFFLCSLDVFACNSLLSWFWPLSASTPCNPCVFLYWIIFTTLHQLCVRVCIWVLWHQSDSNSLNKKSFFSGINTFTVCVQLFS